MREVDKQIIILEEEATDKIKEPQVLSKVETEIQNLIRAQKCLMLSIENSLVSKKSFINSQKLT